MRPKGIGCSHWEPSSQYRRYPDVQLEDAMCHSGYTGWLEGRKNEAAIDQEAQKKRSTAVNELLSDANKRAAAARPTPAPAKDTVPAK